MATFKALNTMCAAEQTALIKIENVKSMMNEAGTELRIHHKTKEDRRYKVEVSFQIMPNGGTTRAIVTCLNKEDNTKREGFIPLYSYEDIYLLIDSISITGDMLTFNPKKSAIAVVANKRYATPLVLNIASLNKL